MINLYYYFLYILYDFYRNKLKERELPLFYVTIVSSLFLFINISSGYLYFKYYYGTYERIEVYEALLIYLIVVCLNYILFIKKRIFLKKNFKKRIVEIAYVILYIVLSLVSILFIFYKFNLQNTI